jgi:hypothetical protein
LPDALAKILGTDFPLMQLILVRFAAQAILLIPLALWMGAAFFPNARIVRLTAVRAMLQMMGLALMFASLRFLPLADAVAIAFVMPFIMLLLGWFYLGEEVGAAPPWGLYRGLHRHVDGGAAKLCRGRLARAFAAWRGRGLCALHAGHTANRAGKRTPWHFRGRRRSLRCPFCCPSRSFRSQPNCLLWAGSRQLAGR